MSEALGKEKTIDLVAWRFIATSIAYYCLDESLVPDHVSDAWGVWPTGRMGRSVRGQQVQVGARTRSGPRVPSR